MMVYDVFLIKFEHNFLEFGIFSTEFDKIQDGGRGGRK